MRLFLQGLCEYWRNIGGRHGGQEQYGLKPILPRLCDVAGAVNSVGRALREVLVLAHIERLGVEALAGTLGVSPVAAATMVAEGEVQLVGLLRGMSAWEDVDEPDVHALLVGLAGCLDRVWAGELGGCALQYLTAWDRAAVPALDGQLTRGAIHRTR